MKKTLSILVLAISFLALSAQQIEDGSFETKWKQYSAEAGTYWDYSYDDTQDLFMTLNVLYQLPEDPLPGALTAFRETNAQDGNYAIRLTSKSLSGVLLVPGAFGTIGNNFVEEFLSQGSITVTQEFPFKPLALKGYYKYTPVSGDSAAIDIELFNGTTSIARASMRQYSAVSTWTPFNIPLVYSDSAAPATRLKLLFIASAGYNFNDLMACVGRVNSSLYIDNIYFEYEVGMVEPLIHTIKTDVFPNPAINTVTFDFHQDVSGDLFIYNLLGEKVGEKTVCQSKTEYDISDLASGSYFYRLINSNKIIASGKFIVK